MKLINQSFEIIDQTDFSLVGIKKFIERCGRVCYKSEDKITDTSYEKFVDMLVKRDHSRPLEFGTVHLKIKYSEFQGFMLALYAKRIYNDIWIESNSNEKVIYITTNYRYYLDIIKHFPWVSNYFDESDNEYYPKRHTVHFISNRAIMDEFRTHVTLSHLAESTRYCNYSKDKFDNQITFIQPSWIILNKEITSINELCFLTNQYDIENPNLRYLASLVQANYAYLSLLKGGYTPQQARDVLPLSIKSELISCGFEDAWSNFFYRRCDNAAHPMAKELTCSLKEEFIKRNYINGN